MLIDPRPTRNVLALPQILAPGERERIDHARRVRDLTVEIIAQSGQYNDQGVHISMLRTGVSLICDFGTALDALLRNDAELDKTWDKKINIKK
jgi:hypothetical protein